MLCNAFDFRLVRLSMMNTSGHPYYIHTQLKYHISMFRLSSIFSSDSGNSIVLCRGQFLEVLL